MGYVRKTCIGCGGKNDVIDGLCDECASNYTYCRSCKTRMVDEIGSVCRHLFWSKEYADWLGSGAYEGHADDSEMEEIKASFFAVLDKTGMVAELAATIRQGRFHIQYYGTIFGADGIWCYLYPEGSTYGVEYGKRFTLDLTDEEQDAMSLGVGWLSTLYDDDAQDANALTLQWIAEYQPQRRAA